ncbi:selenide, water dikinase SelD [Helicobacter sp. 23-1046]
MGPEDLRQITSSLTQPRNDALLVGFESSDDAGALALDCLLDSQQGMPQSRELPNGLVLLSTVDFITPIVDDPYLYGQIAAANSLSDIFAMGGRAINALNLFMWDSTNVDTNAAKEILRGGLDKITESGAFLLGGHTTSDNEQKYGLCVNGLVQKNALWRNNSVQVGDLLVLCKPIGTGILSTAIKGGLSFNQREVVQSMTTLNLRASLEAKKYQIHACTDITGFGLIGHTLEMCGDKTLLLYTQDIPLFDGVAGFVSDGIIPGGTHNNKSAFSKRVSVQCGIDDDIIFYDVQTSGGLVFSLPASEAKSLVYDLRLAGYERADIIGEVLNFRESSIILG